MKAQKTSEADKMRGSLKLLIRQYYLTVVSALVRTKDNMKLCAKKFSLAETIKEKSHKLTKESRTDF